ncbi:hypothetical protein ANCCEY_13932 [Ancylostoma ceylanicum]|uniref:Uncharacterized protein n=1 Tax=Ancylostoma ceylanicum TaxID=53326 RepID=A0A0D6L5Z4_9BILA|nr:hypothetical protein ANCCEY_13932 [Ancylostoma ceylanicum]
MDRCTILGVEQTNNKVEPVGVKRQWSHGFGWGHGVWGRLLGFGGFYGGWGYPDTGDEVDIS